MVTAHFISRRSDADAAIRARLKSLGRAARNWTVVSSDRQVRDAARSAHAGTETSKQFAARMREAPKRTLRGGPRDAESGEGDMSEQELQGWLEFFKRQP
jgi:hypothetical protein